MLSPEGWLGDAASSIEVSSGVSLGYKRAMRIAIGSDHAGFVLKQAVSNLKGPRIQAFQITDFESASTRSWRAVQIVSRWLEAQRGSGCADWLNGLTVGGLRRRETEAAMRRVAVAIVDYGWGVQAARSAWRPILVGEGADLGCQRNP